MEFCDVLNIWNALGYGRYKKRRNQVAHGYGKVCDKGKESFVYSINKGEMRNGRLPEEKLWYACAWRGFRSPGLETGAIAAFAPGHQHETPVMFLEFLFVLRLIFCIC